MAMFKSKGHPVADRVLVLEHEYCSRRFIILFVSVTGPQEIAKSGVDLKNLPMERDMKAPI